ncbi:hypothetical protein CMI41_00570 [Candidatus Pacearchaeota archaeon]|nr:hypothetical protein [Candidatus Pacearchaeota archaeon]|tara:strand:- start:11181 stop:11471 length:291 start_codon:yes stop_codon:yes gene_type:complete
MRPFFGDEVGDRTKDLLRYMSDPKHTVYYDEPELMTKMGVDPAERDHLATFNEIMRVLSNNGDIHVSLGGMGNEDRLYCLPHRRPVISGDGTNNRK